MIDFVNSCRGPIFRLWKSHIGRQLDDVQLGRIEGPFASGAECNNQRLMTLVWALVQDIGDNASWGKTIELVRGNVPQSRVMDKHYVIMTLREHEPELKAAGIVHLRVFGSVARDEASSLSDVDLMAEFDKSKRLTLVKIGSLQNRLTDLLGARVELSSPEWMREPVRSKALREAVLAF